MPLHQGREGPVVPAPDGAKQIVVIVYRRGGVGNSAIPL